MLCAYNVKHVMSMENVISFHDIGQHNNMRVIATTHVHLTFILQNKVKLQEINTTQFFDWREQVKFDGKLSRNYHWDNL